METDIWVVAHQFTFVIPSSTQLVKKFSKYILLSNGNKSIFLNCFYFINFSIKAKIFINTLAE